MTVLGSRVWRLDGGRWSGAAALPDVYSLGLSCATARSCLSSAGTRADIWNGSSWRVGAGLTSMAATDVSCPTPTFCVAVGPSRAKESQDPDREHLASTWNGSSWSAPVDLAASGLIGVDRHLTYVNCPAPGSCIAVVQGQRFLRLAGGHWSEVGPVLRSVPGADPVPQPLYLDSGACPTVHFCAGSDAGFHTLLVAVRL